MLRYLVAFGLALTATGCTFPSLQPLYSEDVAIFDRSLLGSWESDSRESALVFFREEDGAYELIHAGDEGATSRYVVHMVRIGDERYLDVYPKEEESDSLLYALHVVPAHTFWKIRRGPADTMVVSLLDSEWLEEEMESGRLWLSHFRFGDGAILSASTEDIQDWLDALPSEAFTEVETLRRL